MMMMPGPGTLDVMIRERQRRLQGRADQTVTRGGQRLRVRVGRALVVLGAALEGERRERHPCPPAPFHAG
jgi:hypothetical protein